MPLPQEPNPESAYSQLREPFVVVRTTGVTRKLHLIEVTITNTIARVLHAAPELEVLL
jgi:hypothetical protein